MGANLPITRDGDEPSGCILNLSDQKNFFRNSKTSRLCEKPLWELIYPTEGRWGDWLHPGLKLLCRVSKTSIPSFRSLARNARFWVFLVVSHRTIVTSQEVGTNQISKKLCEYTNNVFRYGGTALRYSGGGGEGIVCVKNQFFAVITWGWSFRGSSSLQ